MKISASQDEQDPGTHSSGVKSGFLTPREAHKDEKEIWKHRVQRSSSIMLMNLDFILEGVRELSHFSKWGVNAWSNLHLRMGTLKAGRG